MSLIEKFGKGLLLAIETFKNTLISKWSYYIQDIVEHHLIYTFYHCVDSTSHSEVSNSALGQMNSELISALLSAYYHHTSHTP